MPNASKIKRHENISSSNFIKKQEKKSAWGKIIDYFPDSQTTAISKEF